MAKIKKMQKIVFYIYESRLLKTNERRLKHSNET